MECRRMSKGEVYQEKNRQVVFGPENGPLLQSIFFLAESNKLCQLKLLNEQDIHSRSRLAFELTSGPCAPKYRENPCPDAEGHWRILCTDEVECNEDEEEEEEEDESECDEDKTSEEYEEDEEEEEEEEEEEDTEECEDELEDDEECENMEDEEDMPCPPKVSKCKGNVCQESLPAVKKEEACAKKNEEKQKVAKEEKISQECDEKQKANKPEDSKEKDEVCEFEEEFPDICELEEESVFMDKEELEMICRKYKKYGSMSSFSNLPKKKIKKKKEDKDAEIDRCQEEDEVDDDADDENCDDEPLEWYTGEDRNPKPVSPCPSETKEGKKEDPNVKSASCPALEEDETSDKKRYYDEDVDKMDQNKVLCREVREQDSSCYEKEAQTKKLNNSKESCEDSDMELSASQRASLYYQYSDKKDTYCYANSGKKRNQSKQPRNEQGKAKEESQKRKANLCECNYFRGYQGNEAGNTNEGDSSYFCYANENKNTNNGHGFGAETYGDIADDTTGHDEGSDDERNSITEDENEDDTQDSDLTDDSDEDGENENKSPNCSAQGDDSGGESEDENRVKYTTYGQISDGSEVYFHDDGTDSDVSEPDYYEGCEDDLDGLPIAPTDQNQSSDNGVQILSHSANSILHEPYVDEVSNKTPSTEAIVVEAVQTLDTNRTEPFSRRIATMANSQYENFIRVLGALKNRALTPDPDYYFECIDSEHVANPPRASYSSSKLPISEVAGSGEPRKAIADSRCGRNEMRATGPFPSKQSIRSASSPPTHPSFADKFGITEKTGSVFDAITDMFRKTEEKLGVIRSPKRPETKPLHQPTRLPESAPQRKTDSNTKLKPSRSMKEVPHPSRGKVYGPSLEAKQEDLLYITRRYHIPSREDLSSSSKSSDRLLKGFSIGQFQRKLMDQKEQEELEDAIKSIREAKQSQAKNLTGHDTVINHSYGARQSDNNTKRMQYERQNTVESKKFGRTQSRDTLTQVHRYHKQDKGFNLGKFQKKQEERKEGEEENVKEIDRRKSWHTVQDMTARNVQRSSSKSNARGRSQTSLLTTYDTEKFNRSPRSVGSKTSLREKSRGRQTNLSTDDKIENTNRFLRSVGSKTSLREKSRGRQTNLSTDDKIENTNRFLRSVGSKTSLREKSRGRQTNLSTDDKIENTHRSPRSVGSKSSLREKSWGRQTYSRTDDKTEKANRSIYSKGLKSTTGEKSESSFKRSVTSGGLKNETKEKHSPKQTTSSRTRTNNSGDKYSPNESVIPKRATRELKESYKPTHRRGFAGRTDEHKNKSLMRVMGSRSQVNKDSESCTPKTFLDSLSHTNDHETHFARRIWPLSHNQSNSIETQSRWKRVVGSRNNNRSKKNVPFSESSEDLSEAGPAHLVSTYSKNDVSPVVPENQGAKETKAISVRSKERFEGHKNSIEKKTITQLGEKGEGFDECDSCCESKMKTGKVHLESARSTKDNGKEATSLRTDGRRKTYGTNHSTRDNVQQIRSRHSIQKDRPASEKRLATNNRNVIPHRVLPEEDYEDKVAVDDEDNFSEKDVWYSKSSIKRKAQQEKSTQPAELRESHISGKRMLGKGENSDPETDKNSPDAYKNSHRTESASPERRFSKKLSSHAKRHKMSEDRSFPGKRSKSAPRTQEPETDEIFNEKDVNEFSDSLIDISHNSSAMWNSSVEMQRLIAYERAQLHQSGGETEHLHGESSLDSHYQVEEIMKRINATDPLQSTSRNRNGSKNSSVAHEQDGMERVNYNPYLLEDDEKGITTTDIPHRLRRGLKFQIHRFDHDETANVARTQELYPTEDKKQSLIEEIAGMLQRNVSQEKITQTSPDKREELFSDGTTNTNARAVECGLRSKQKNKFRCFIPVNVSYESFVDTADDQRKPTESPYKEGLEGDDCQLKTTECETSEDDVDETAPCENEETGISNKEGEIAETNDTAMKRSRRQGVGNGNGNGDSLKNNKSTEVEPQGHERVENIKETALNYKHIESKAKGVRNFELSNCSFDRKGNDNSKVLDEVDKLVNVPTVSRTSGSVVPSLESKKKGLQVIKGNLGKITSEVHPTSKVQKVTESEKTNDRQLTDVNGSAAYLMRVRHSREISKFRDEHTSNKSDREQFTNTTKSQIYKNRSKLFKNGSVSSRLIDDDRDMPVPLQGSQKKHKKTVYIIDIEKKKSEAQKERKAEKNKRYATPTDPENANKQGDSSRDSEEKKHRNRERLGQSENKISSQAFDTNRKDQNLIMADKKSNNSDSEKNKYTLNSHLGSAVASYRIESSKGPRVAIKQTVLRRGKSPVTIPLESGARNDVNKAQKSRSPKFYSEHPASYKSRNVKAGNDDRVSLNKNRKESEKDKANNSEPYFESFSRNTKRSNSRNREVSRDHPVVRTRSESYYHLNADEDEDEENENDDSLSHAAPFNHILDKLKRNDKDASGQRFLQKSPVRQNSNISVISKSQEKSLYFEYGSVLLNRQRSRSRESVRTYPRALSRKYSPSKIHRHSSKKRSSYSPGQLSAGKKSPSLPCRECMSPVPRELSYNPPPNTLPNPPPDLVVNSSHPNPRVKSYKIISDGTRPQVLDTSVILQNRYSTYMSKERDGSEERRQRIPSNGIPIFEAKHVASKNNNSIFVTEKDHEQSIYAYERMEHKRRRGNRSPSSSKPQSGFYGNSLHPTHLNSDFLMIPTLLPTSNKSVAQQKSSENIPQREEQETEAKEKDKRNRKKKYMAKDRENVQIDEDASQNSPSYDSQESRGFRQKSTKKTPCSPVSKGNSAFFRPDYKQNTNSNADSFIKEKKTKKRQRAQAAMTAMKDAEQQAQYLEALREFAAQFSKTPDILDEAEEQARRTDPKGPIARVKKMNESLQGSFEKGDGINETLTSLREWNLILFLVIFSIFLGTCCPGLMRHIVSCPVRSACDGMRYYVLKPLGVDDTVDKWLGSREKTVWQSLCPFTKKERQTGIIYIFFYHAVKFAFRSMVSFVHFILLPIITFPFIVSGPVLNAFYTSLICAGRIFLQTVSYCCDFLLGPEHQYQQESPEEGKVPSSDDITPDKVNDVSSNLHKLRKHGSFFFYFGFDDPKEECDFNFLTSFLLNLVGKYPKECL